MSPPPTPALRQRDYLLGIARAMTEALEPRDVMALVLKTAVTMTGGTAGAIAIRGDGGGSVGSAGAGGPEVGRGAHGDDGLRIVASYHLEEKLVEHLHSSFDPAWSAPAAGSASVRGGSSVTAAGAEPAAAVDSLTSERMTALALPPANFSLPALPPPAGPLVAVRTLPGDDEDLDVVTLPLRRRAREIGQIVVFRSQGAAVFASADDEVLRAFADQAAIAIENAMLHARLAAREHQLAEVVDGSPTGILLLDGAGRIVGANPAAERLLGVRREDLAGRALGDALPLEAEDGRRVALEPAGAAEGGGPIAGRLPGGPRQPWLQIEITPMAPVALAVGEVDAPNGGASTSASPAGSAPAAAGGYVVNVVDVSALREAEAAKNTFLAGLSHELKTPLALIRGFAETLQQPQMAGDDAFRAQAVDVILDETTHLTHMVDQLLLAARLRAGALPLDRHTVDLRAMLARSVESFRRVHPDRRWQTELADVGPIVADPVRLREVFDNLLSNAVKYSAPGTPIAVVLGGDGADDDGRAGEVIVQVIDRGIGIDPADQAQLFGRFFRAHTDGGADGTGLGLYMCRAIVGAHGGRIDVRSTPGEGSTFTVRLPRAAAERGGIVSGDGGAGSAGGGQPPESDDGRQRGST
ncbi:MAG: PAS domain-containing protein [Ardenticatenales bacterium]|nr:PAS domain-containing protein [Ardenticatenales bacterium]